jgi:hypothetical protein
VGWLDGLVVVFLGSLLGSQDSLLLFLGVFIQVHN